jgi:DNA-binding MarR family transcriptional regulator
MNKNMQISKLLISKDGIEDNNNSNSNFQNIYNLLNFDDKNQNQNQITDTFLTNGNYEPLQLLNYKVDLLNDDSHPISINDLRDNDRKILSLLKDEIVSTYSFKALERKLNIHQQSLSRALKRLVELDLIEKVPAGYKLIEKNNFISNTALENSKLLEEDEEESFRVKKTRKRFDQLIQIRIPIRYKIKSIINHLIGKWFGNLRWFGIIKKETGSTLQWIAIDKYSNNKLFQINVNIVSEYIVIESNAVSDKEKVQAMSSSNKIVSEIIKIIQENQQEEEEEELEIPNDYAPIYNSEVKYNFKKNK